MDIFKITIVISSLIVIASLKCLQEHPHSINCTRIGYTSIPLHLPRGTHYLSLSQNHISYLGGDAIQLYPQLRYLNLDYNEITTTDHIKAIAALQELEEIHLSKNDLHHFDFGVFFYNINLEKIVVDDNPHLSLKERPVQMEQLKAISLQRNRLINFPLAALKGFLNLEALDLSGNGLRVIPNDLEEVFGNLKKLILLRNPLKHVEQVLLPKRYLMITSGTEYLDKSHVIKKSIDYYRENDLKTLEEHDFAGKRDDDLENGNENVVTINRTDRISDELKYKKKFASDDNVVIVVGVILVIIMIISVLGYFCAITHSARKQQLRYQFLNTNQVY